MKRVLVIEDGSEYAEFAGLFLPGFTVRAAHSAREALQAAATDPFDFLLIDLRFDRVPVEALIGDVEATAQRLFGGEQARAVRHLQDQQGVLILAELRAAGHHQPAVFVHEFPARRLHNLRSLYGDVRAVPNFDAAALCRALGGGS